MPTDVANPKTNVGEFLALAQDRFKLAAESEAANRRDSLDDLEFSIGNQWPMDIKAQRQLDGRPCLTMNKLPQFIRQVTNEQRQQRPSIVINPIGDGADVQTAEILQGIVRHIEVQSRGDEVYDTAFDYMVRGGFGCWRVVTDYISETEDTQEIYLRPIDNPFTVYLDPTNKRDPSWGFIVEDLLAAEFKRQFPESEYAKGTASLTEYESVGDTPSNWAQTIDGNPSIRIAEYFTVEKKKGSTGKEIRRVEWSKISALDKLDSRDWPGKYIPIIKIYGDDILVNGKRHIAGIVRDAKDPMRQYNYWCSAMTERIALAPKAPWLIAEGQTEGYERQWEQSNSRNMATLTYKPKAFGGQPLPPPQRNVVEPGIQGMSEMLQLANQDLQATTGLYPNNLGEKQTSNESGKAVLARQKQGDINTLNYSDNLARGLEYTGRIILDLIPQVYTTPKVQRIVKPDMTVSTVGIINSKSGDDMESAEQELEDQQIKKIYDIGVGTYDVAVSTGPSYQSKRQEAVASQIALVQAFPQVFPLIGDQIVRNMDWPGANEIADRLKKMLPSQLQDSEDQSPEAQLMQAQQQLAQLGAQHQQLVMALQETQKIIDTKQVEQQGKFAIEQMKTNVDLVIQKAKIDAQIAVAEINTKAQSAAERAQIYLEVYKELHGSAHETGMQATEHAHAQQLAQQQAQAAAQQQQSQQGADQQSQQSDQTHELGMAAVQGSQQQQNGNQGGE